MGPEASGINYTQDTTKVDLSDKRLDDIPNLIPDDNVIQELNCKGNRLTSLPTNLIHLETLILSNNALSSIPPQMLESILLYPNIKHLDLSLNSISCVPDQLASIPTLVTLKLFSNKITTLDLPFQKLESLDISQNLIHDVPPSLPNTIQTLKMSFNRLQNLSNLSPNITRLELTMNMIEIIDPSLSLPNLVRLDLSRNRLSSLPDFTTFAPKLEWLDLSNNLLVEMPHLTESTLIHLDISHNKLTSLTNFLVCFENLVHLNVSDNQLLVLPLLPQSICELIASCNKIEQVSPTDTPNLKLVDLDRNCLTETPLFFNNAIKELHLERNLIVKLESELFTDTLAHLFLAHNMISDIPSTIFALPHLTQMKINHNLITSLPANISSTPIYYLNLSNNPLSNIPEVPSNLVRLFISNCGLTSVPVLSQCSKMKLLDISRNLITDISTLPASLKQLYAARNRLTTLPALPRKLEILDVSCNLIDVIASPLRHDHLIELDLSYNGLTDLPHIMLPRLSVLKLGFNPLACELPDSLPALEMLDITSTVLVPEKKTKKFKQVLMSGYKGTNNHFARIECGFLASHSEMRGLRDKMEDTIIVRDKLYAVFDGHGGSKTSIVASLMFPKLWENAPFTTTAMCDAVAQLQTALKKRHFNDGATMAVVALEGGKAILAHLGDARILIIKQNGDITYATHDHSPSERNEFERILLKGGRVVNGRVNSALATARSLGDFYLFPHDEPDVADVVEITLAQDDKWIIVACDGVFDVIDNDDIGRIVAKSSCARDLAYDVVREAFAAGSSDNISVIAVDIN